MLKRFYIEQIDKDTNEVIATYLTAMIAERKTGVNHSNIAKVINGKLKTSGGYKWRVKYNR